MARSDAPLDSPAKHPPAVVLGVVTTDLLNTSEPLPLLERLCKLADRKVVVSFPRLVHPFVPLRYGRLRLAGCPVFFYRRGRVEAYARELLAGGEVVSFRRDYLMIGTPR